MRRCIVDGSDRFEGVGSDKRPLSGPLLKPEGIWRVQAFLMRLHDAARTNASCANSCPFMGTVDDEPDPLKIRVPTPLRYIVSMADIIPKRRSLATDLTPGCHVSLLFSNKKQRTIADFPRTRQTPSAFPC